LHGDVRLLHGGDLHALVAIQMSQTFKEALPSLERKDTESAVINALRKELDRKQLELLHTSKLQPLPIPTRHFTTKAHTLACATAAEDAREPFLQRKVFWLGTKRPDDPAAQVWIADPIDAEYLGTTGEKLLSAARRLSGQGSLLLHGERAAASEKLLAHAETF